MIDAAVNCPTVPARGFGTVGQPPPSRDSTRDSSGTGGLKALAAAVLARDTARDTCGTTPALAVPAFPIIPDRVGTPQADALPPIPSIPGVPPAWSEGVWLLASQRAPASIQPRRWPILQADANRLLREHGAELHAFGWNTIDVFGLHAIAPETNPAGSGLAWLLDGGEVLDVAPGEVGMVRRGGGARLVFRPRSAATRASAIPAWKLTGTPSCPVVSQFELAGHGKL